MKVVCWNTDDAVWDHWKSVIAPEWELVRLSDSSEVVACLEREEGLVAFCFVYLPEQDFTTYVEQTVTLKRTFPDMKLIAFPNKSSQEAAFRLFSQGLNGLCNPYIGKEQLSLVLSVVEAGEIWGGRAFIESLIQHAAAADNPLLSESTSNEVEEACQRLQPLTKREKDVAEQVAKGLNNKQIASAMNITDRTVKAHMTAIFKKTDTRDRLALALLVQTSQRSS